MNAMVGEGLGSRTLVQLHPNPLSQASYSAVELLPDNDAAVLLDQRRLPLEEVYVRIASLDHMAAAIATLAVRGAPAIGIAAAYGMVLAARAERAQGATFLLAMQKADAVLRATRPTAVNLAWATGHMLTEAQRWAEEPVAVRNERLAEAARAIHRADVESCRRMGQWGAARVPDGATVLTHCNAGALATGGYGTALGVIRAAHEAGKNIRVIADETRPVLQGARLTAWELLRDGIPVTLITDSMAAVMMAQGRVQMVVVGADRIARNGDVANKIGTYGVACLAQAHGIPFDVAAPWSTVDLSCPGGSAIPIEERHGEEVRSMPVRGEWNPVAPLGIAVANPSFDVTPARWIRAIYTERGEALAPGQGSLEALAGASRGGP
jgi:methylthioribose-1-phosphate isomerase